MNSASPCDAPVSASQQPAAPCANPAAAALITSATPISTPIRSSLTVGDDSEITPTVSVHHKTAAAVKAADKGNKRSHELVEEQDADETIEEMGPDSMVVDSLLAFLTNYTSSLHNLGTSSAVIFLIATG